MISVLSYLWSSPIAFTIILCAAVYFVIKRYIKSKGDVWTDQGLKTVNRQTFSTFGKEFYRVEHELVLKGGKLFGSTNFGKPVLYCSEPELIRIILSKDFHIFPNRGTTKTGAPLIDNSLAMVGGDQWKRIRSVMSPTFSSGKLRRMKPLIDECIATMIENFENQIKSGKIDCDVKKLFGAYSMDLLISVAFGNKINSLIDENNPIIINSKKFASRDFSYSSLFKLFVIILLPKLAKMLEWSLFDDRAMNFFKELTIKIVDERKKNPGNVKRCDFLQLMMEAIESKGSEILEKSDAGSDSMYDPSHEEIKFVTHNKTLTSDEFIAQCFIFFFAGYDSISTTLSYATYNLALNHKVQQLLYEEAKNVMESNKEIDYDTIHSLKYLDAVISESLRLFPAAVTLFRSPNQEHTLSDTAIVIPKNCQIIIPIYSMHRDADNFPDPESFKPERFFPENRIHHPYAYLPFGYGPRHCVAMRLALMEVKMSLLYLVYRFKFSISSKTEMPPKCYTGLGIPALNPKSVVLKIEKR